MKELGEVFPHPVSQRGRAREPEDSKTDRLTFTSGQSRLLRPARIVFHGEQTDSVADGEIKSAPLAHTADILFEINTLI